MAQWCNTGAYCCVSMNQVHKTISSSRLGIVFCLFCCSVSFYYYYVCSAEDQTQILFILGNCSAARATSPSIFSIFVFFCRQGHTMYPRLASNLQSPCFSLPSAGIIGMHQMTSYFLSVHSQKI